MGKFILKFIWKDTGLKISKIKYNTPTKYTKDNIYNIALVPKTVWHWQRDTEMSGKE